MEKLPVEIKMLLKNLWRSLKTVDREGFIPEQVFNCDETGLFWKKYQKGPTSQEKRRLVFMECVSPSKQ